MFNSSNWYVEQDVYIMALDDDIILDSPYGSVITMATDSSKEEYVKESDLTVLAFDTDEGESVWVICEGVWVVRVLKIFFLLPSLQ